MGPRQPAAATERPLRLARGTITSEVDTCKNEAYRGVHEALRAGMRHRQSPGRRRRTVEPPPGAGADFWPAPLPRPGHRPAGHPQQRPRRTPEGPAGRRRHRPAHPPGTDRRDRVRADRRRPGAAARTPRAAGLGPALRTRTGRGRRGPARLGTAGRRGPAPDGDAVVTMSADTLYRLVLGHTTVTGAVRHSTVDGDTGIAHRALEPLAAAFTKPAPAR